MFDNKDQEIAERVHKLDLFYPNHGNNVPRQANDYSAHEMLLAMMRIKLVLYVKATWYPLLTTSIGHH